MVFLLLFLLAAPQPSTQAAHSVITGRIVAGAPPSPVAGVTVRVDTIAAVTDADGRFTLTIPSALSVHLTISAAGYIEQQVDVPVTDGRGDAQVVLLRSPEYREEVV